MTMIPSTSSQIASYGYNAEDETLRVEFRSGGTYVYSGVDSDKFAEMQASDSHGKFLHSRVKQYHQAEKVAPIADKPLANDEEIS
jgi:hypothetical protein